MERKTRIQSDDGKQQLMITREFDLPLELLFTAYTEPEIVEQWMGTKVLKLENKKHGCYQFETTDPKGNKHGFNGTIHEFVPNRKITRTFEMENTPFGVQLEFLEFPRWRRYAAWLGAAGLSVPLKVGICAIENTLNN